jgi:hypothetical protein
MTVNSQRVLRRLGRNCDIARRLGLRASQVGMKCSPIAGMPCHIKMLVARRIRGWLTVGLERQIKNVLVIRFL